MIKKIKVDLFTAFDTLDIDFSPGLNLFIGENGTGKTHILKAIYAACDITKSKKGFAEKINDVFYPSSKQIGRLVKRSPKSNRGYIEVKREISDGTDIALRLSLTNHTLTPDKAIVSGSSKQWLDNPIESVFIPVKDMMANTPGFRSLFALRELHFEEVYSDIIKMIKEQNLDGIRKSLRSNAIDYPGLYSHVFECAGEFKSPGDVILLVGEHLYRDSIISIKEINFLTMVVSILKKGLI